MLWTIIIGAICGYIASRILGGDGFGIIGNIVIGVLGGVIGNYLSSALKLGLGSGWIGDIVSGVLGSIVFLVVLEFFKQKAKPSRRR